MGLIAQNFKVVGYLPHYRFQKIENINLDQLTHLNIAFGNPNMEGKIQVGGKDLKPIVEEAKQLDLKVLLSLGGGALLRSWQAAWARWMLPERRGEFIGNIVRFLQECQMDGVDVDLEWKYVDEHYSGFILDLRDSLKLHDLLLTAAFPGNHRYEDLTDEALQAFDFVNIMAYDLKGPWSRRSPGDHSPLSFARESIDFWKEQQLDPDKIVLGLPFYGYHFGKTRVSTFAYSRMIERDTARAFLDRVGASFYNGIPTIMEKTAMALEEAGGVMVWELGLDAENEYSLLNAISERIDSLTTLNPLPDFRFYPNPVIDLLQIESAETIDDARLYLFDSDGRFVFFRRLSGQTWEVDASGLPSGIYNIILTKDGSSSMHQVIKI